MPHHRVGGEIAGGSNPADLLEQMTAPAPAARTFALVAETYRQSRIDVTPGTAGNLVSQLAAIVRVFGARDPETITPGDVQEWISGLSLKPSTVRRYVATLRQVLDYADVTPNPARDPKVRLPRQEREQITPPSARDVEAIILHAPARWRLLLTTLAETGMRISELLAITWADVDQAGERIRISKGKTNAARRWVPISADLLHEIATATPPDDRTGRVFAGTPAAVQNVMTGACQSAGIAHYHPHDFRHRWISLQVKRGVPITEISAIAGHSQNAITWNVYSHVLLDDSPWWCGPGVVSTHALGPQSRLQSETA